MQSGLKYRRSAIRKQKDKKSWTKGNPDRHKPIRLETKDGRSVKQHEQSSNERQLKFQQSQAKVANKETAAECFKMLTGRREHWSRIHAVFAGNNDYETFVPWIPICEISVTIGWQNNCRCKGSTSSHEAAHLTENEWRNDNRSGLTGNPWQNRIRPMKSRAYALQMRVICLPCRARVSVPRTVGLSWLYGPKTGIARYMARKWR